MRTVLADKKLEEKDLPKDKDLRGSYWRNVDGTGWDLREYDMRDMDIWGEPGKLAPMRAVKLPGNVDLMVSRYVDWTDAVIPKMVSSLNHDLVAEVLRQHTAPLGSKEREIINWTLAHISESYHNSWDTAAYHVVEELGWTREEDKACFIKYAFGEYPRLINRLHSHLAGELHKDPPTYSRTSTSVKDRERGIKLQLPYNILEGHEDRWATERMAEMYLSTGVSRPWQIKIFGLHPWVFTLGRVKTDDNEMWWPEGMGI